MALAEVLRQPHGHCAGEVKAPELALESKKQHSLQFRGASAAVSLAGLGAFMRGDWAGTKNQVQNQTWCGPSL